MGFAECEFNDFSNTRNAIDNYLKIVDMSMTKADNLVGELMVQWQGKDATEFKKVWDTYSVGDESINQMYENSLKSFSRYLWDVERLYRQAQLRAFESAKRNCN